MNSQTIQDQIYQWVINKGVFDAPYGVLTGTLQNRKGRKYLSVTFGRARTLDATVEIYNRNFILLKTSRGHNEVFKNVADLQQILDTL